ncbi:conserved hypothetical protein [Vibrio chagasii]|nr:conserved hypothetical protein [Vibrio chagasii]
MTISSNKYQATVPLLNFVRGWVIVLTLFMIYTSLFSSSHSYQAPIFEVICLCFVAVLMSWTEFVEIKEGKVITFYRHSLFTFIETARFTYEIQDGWTLEARPSKFGYTVWTASRDTASTQIFHTGEVTNCQY